MVFLAFIFGFSEWKFADEIGKIPSGGAVSGMGHEFVVVSRDPSLYAPFPGGPRDPRKDTRRW